MTLLVRDEIDIIHTFLDFHFAEGVDFMMVTDNGSVDGTLDVLREYESEGRIEIIHEPPSDYSQNRWVTRMAQLAATRHDADWIINADADEFFFWRKGSLRDVFADLPPRIQVFGAARHDFVPLERPGREAVPCEMTHRVADSLNLFNRRPLIPKAIHRADPGVEVGMGNHKVSGERFPRRFELGGIEVYHYPIRSYPQFESKAVNTGSSLEKNTELSDKVAQRPRLWYRLWKEGKLEDEFRNKVHFSPERLEAALASGDVIEDPSLARRLREHGLA